MTTMIAKAPFGLENITAADRPDPGDPGPGEIRVKIHANSLNFHDYAVVKGIMAPEDGRIPLSDGAGEVEAVGEGVTDFAVGDRVVSTFFPTWEDGRAPLADFSQTPGDGMDGFATDVVVRPQSAFTHAPKGWSHEEAATITTAGLTAWRALVVHGQVKPGDTVLTLGTGGVSIYAAQIAMAAGARVIGTSSKPEKLDRLKDMGVAHTINYEETPEWGKTVLELTDGRGVDHIVEVGGPGTLAQSFTAIRLGGQIHLIGVLTGASGEMPTAALMSKQADLRGFIVGSRTHQKEMVAGLEATGLRPVIDRSFPLGDLAAAFEHEENGRHFGKIVIGR